MSKNIEVRWALFLFAVLLISFGLITGFSLDESIDVQLYDTYYVVSHLHLLIAIGLLLMMAGFFSFGLKKLAVVSKFLKTTSVLIAAVLGLGFASLFVLLIVVFDLFSTIKENGSIYGVLVISVALAILFLVRSYEIGKMK